MTTKQKILDELHRRQEGTLGVIRATYDDCIDIVAQMPDRELELGRKIADLYDTVRELEGLLAEMEAAPHAHWEKMSRIWYRCSRCGKFVAITYPPTVGLPRKCWSCEAIIDEEVCSSEE